MIHDNWTFPKEITPEFYKRLKYMLNNYIKRDFLCFNWLKYKMCYFDFEECSLCRYFFYKGITEMSCPMENPTKKNIEWIKESIKRYEEAL